MDISSLVNNVVNQAIVRVTGGKDSTGINGFVFDILGDEEVSFDSEITDHYVEKNYSIQDHIALRPPKFTLSGYVGELSDLFQNSFLNILTAVQSMGMIGDYTPTFAAQATQVYNKIQAVASKIGTIVNEVKNVYSIFTGVDTSATKQQSAYNYFVNLWMDRTIVSVETPWAVWETMAIENVRILQRDSNKFVSEFSITFKQIRVVETKSYTPVNFALNGTFQPSKPLSKLGSISDYTSEPSYVSQSVAGQSILNNGTLVTSGLLQSAFTSLQR